MHQYNVYICTVWSCSNIAEREGRGIPSSKMSSSTFSLGEEYCPIFATPITSPQKLDSACSTTNQQFEYELTGRLVDRMMCGRTPLLRPPVGSNTRMLIDDYRTIIRACIPMATCCSPRTLKVDAFLAAPAMMLLNATCGTVCDMQQNIM